MPWDHIAQSDPYEVDVEQCNDDEMSNDVTFMDDADLVDRWREAFPFFCSRQLCYSMV